MKRKSFLFVFWVFILLLPLTLVFPQTVIKQKKTTFSILKVTVPDLIGKTFAQAKEILENKKLGCVREIILTEKAEFQGKEGTIVRQDPQPGSETASGTKVRLVEYNPPKNVRLAVRKVDLLIDNVYWTKHPTRNTDRLIVLIMGKESGKPVKDLNQLDIKVVLRDKNQTEIYYSLATFSTSFSSDGIASVIFDAIPYGKMNDTYYIRLTIDPLNKIIDTNMANNEFETKSLADFAVKSMWIEDAGSYYKIKATIKNMGTVKQTKVFSYTWYVEGKADSLKLDVYLGPNQEYTINTTARKESIPADKNSLQVKLHLNDGLVSWRNKVIAEIDYANNILEQDLSIPN